MTDARGAFIMRLTARIKQQISDNRVGEVILDEDTIDRIRALLLEVRLRPEVGDLANPDEVT